MAPALIVDVAALQPDILISSHQPGIILPEMPAGAMIFPRQADCTSPATQSNAGLATRNLPQIAIFLWR